MRIAFYLDHEAKVSLAILTLMGEEVWRDEWRGTAGLQQAFWDLRNRAGRAAASGMYLCAVQIDEGGNRRAFTGKLLVMR